ncbi:MAG: PAS domain S-box protein [Acidobacteriota bacterium]|nr:PAS domain S-box protein [Acidobacteriota bacterium]
MASASDSPSRGERELLDANQRLQSVLNANEVATWTWDIANDRVIADENLARLFGMTPEEAAGGPVEKYLQAIHPDDRPRVAAAVKKALEGPQDRYETDYRIVRKDGCTSWVTARGRVKRDTRGKPQLFPGVILDITERKLSEQKTEELHRRLERQSRIFDTTLSSITDFAYIFDRNCRFLYANQALLDLWGIKLEEAVGKDFFDLKYPDELAARLQRQIQQVIDTKAGLTDETPYTSPTGASGYYEYIFRPVFDHEGNVEVVAGSTRDITERKRVEEELRQSQESFRVLAETLENQVRSRTTELEERTNHVVTQSEQLRDLSVRLMETQDQTGRRIARELHDSAGQTIAALAMTLGQIQREVQSSSPTVIELAEEARNYAQELGREIRTTSYLLHPPMLDEIGLQAALSWYVGGLKERAGLDVTLIVDGEFERPSREMELTIFRVVQECLTNVHRHSGSKVAHIKLAREGANVVVEVRDEGRGMSPGNLVRMREKSSGLGLRGIRERVRTFAGDVRIESQVGVGTTILVTLPQSGPR